METNNYVIENKDEKKLPLRTRHIEVFLFIKSYIEKHGFSPTYDEMAKNFNIKKQNITRFINRLEDLGYIVRNRGKNRNITIIRSILE